MSTLKSGIKNKWVETDTYVRFYGILIPFEKHLKLVAENTPLTRLERVSPKQSNSNTGSTAFDKRTGYKLYSEFPATGESPVCRAIFSVWTRNDGFATRVFKWEGSEEEFDNYKPDNHTPHAIAKGYK